MLIMYAVLFIDSYRLVQESIVARRCHATVRDVHTIIRQACTCGRATFLHFCILTLVHILQVKNLFICACVNCMRAFTGFVPFHVVHSAPLELFASSIIVLYISVIVSTNTQSALTLI